jgi:tetratricopeptide (TPR) repeat protein
LARAADLTQQGRWAAALAVLEPAQQRLDESDGPVSREVRQAVADLELVRRLEMIRLQAATMAGRTFDFARADRAYEAEFRGTGLGGADEPAEAVAQRIRASGVRAALVAALDHWTLCIIDPGRRDWVMAVVRDADQESDWSQRVRASWTDPAARKVLAREVPVRRASPQLLLTLAQGLAEPRETVRLLRKAQAQYPGDFWINHALAARLREEGRYAEAARFSQAALAARPGTPAALLELGLALKGQERLDEACDCFRQALELDPRLAYAHLNLGNILLALKKPDEAIACWHKTLAIDPDCARAHMNLGIALESQGHLPEALASYRKAVALDPNDALVQYNLGNGLRLKGEPTKAAACYRRAIQIDPRDAKFHTNLGVVLNAQGQKDLAIACYRKAIAINPNVEEAQHSLGITLLAQNELKEAILHLQKAVELLASAENYYDLGTAWAQAGDWEQAIESLRKAVEINPGHARAHCNLGQALMRRGDFAEALAALRRGDELGSKRGDWGYDSATWVRNCEQMAHAEQELLRILAGSAEPGDAGKRYQWALLCFQTRRYVAAARLAGEAFGADGKLADNFGSGYRYRAATAAALAGAGQGRDAGNLTTDAQAALRRRALDWLNADLAAWRSHGEKSQRARALRSWQADKALAGYRDEKGLASLPGAERAAWRGLWTDVEMLLKPAG